MWKCRVRYMIFMLRKIVSMYCYIPIYDNLLFEGQKLIASLCKDKLKKNNYVHNHYFMIMANGVHSSICSVFIYIHMYVPFNNTLAETKLN